MEQIRAILDYLQEFNTVSVILKKDVYVETLPAKSGIVGNIGFNVTTSYKHDYEQIRKDISLVDGVNFVVQS